MVTYDIVFYFALTVFAGLHLPRTSSRLVRVLFEIILISDLTATESKRRKKLSKVEMPQQPAIAKRDTI